MFGFSDKPDARRPTRSKDNELGSGDLARKEHIKHWLKPTDELDTELPVTNIKGGDGIITKKGSIYIPNDERNRHVLIIAKTGSGKTTRLILPVLYSDCLSPHRSTVVLDSKPEMWDKLAGLTRKYNPDKKILLFNPLDRLRSLSWNILSKVEDDTDAKLIANTVITATDNPASKSDSPFFRNNALQLLTALMLGLLKDPNDVLSMPRIHALSHSGKEHLCDWLEARPDAIRISRTFVELCRSGSQNADTVLSELTMRLAAWDLSTIRATTYFEELDLECLIEHPTLFIIELRESEIEMLRPMANVIIIEILRYLTKRAESCPGHKLPRPIGLVIDEFASALGRLPDIHVKLNTLRSRNVSIVAAIQSISQIKANYEKDADSVLTGFSTKILMPMLDFQDAEWASKETGTMTVRYKTQNRGKNYRIIDKFANTSRGYQEMVQQRAVLTPDEIGRPLHNEATFFLPNSPVFQGHLTPFYEMPEMLKRVQEKTDFKLREKPIQLDEEEPAPIPKKKDLSNGHLSPEEVKAQLVEAKDKLGWDKTSGVAREWWENFEKHNATKLGLVLSLANELLKKEATIYEFFLAYVYSGTQEVEANLKFLDRMIEAKDSGADIQDEALKEAVSYM